MVTTEDSATTYEYDKHFIVYPQVVWNDKQKINESGRKVEDGGSIIPFFHNIIKNGGNELPITDYRMTRFWISLTEGVELVIKALEEATGGETFIR